MNPSTNRPEPEIRIKEVTVFVDPFEEFIQKKHREEDVAQGRNSITEEKDESSQKTEDDQVTWTGKRVRSAGATTSGRGGDSGSVGKYLKAALAERAEQKEDEDEIVEVMDEPEAELEPSRKKIKGSGSFGDFSSW